MNGRHSVREPLPRPRPLQLPSVDLTVNVDVAVGEAVAEHVDFDGEIREEVDRLKQEVEGLRSDLRALRRVLDLLVDAVVEPGDMVARRHVASSRSGTPAAGPAGGVEPTVEDAPDVGLLPRPDVGGTSASGERGLSEADVRLIVREELAPLHHETHRNDGSSIKDSTVRLEAQITESGPAAGGYQVDEYGNRIWVPAVTS